MSGKHTKRLLAAAAAAALLTGLLATNWMWAGAEPAPVFPETGEHILIDPAAGKNEADMAEAEKPSAGHAVKTVGDLTALKAGQSGAPDGTAYYFKSHDTNNRSGMALNGLNRNVLELDANPSGWMLDMWIWLESTTGLVVVRLMGFDVNLSTIDGFGYQWNKEMDGGDIDDMTAGTQPLQEGWNHVRKLLVNCGKGAGLETLQSLVVEQHSANTAGFGVAVSSAKLARVPMADEVALFDTDDAKAAEDAGKIATPAVSVEDAPADTASGFPGGKAYVMETNPTGASGITLLNKRQAGLETYVGRITDSQRRKYGDRYRMEAWIWVDDNSKVGQLRIDLTMPAADTSGYTITLNKSADIDDTRDGAQTLQAGWNHVVKYVENLTPKGAEKNRLFFTGLRFFENGAGHTVKIASMKLVKDCTDPVAAGSTAVTPDGDKAAADMRDINNPSVRLEVVDIASLSAEGDAYVTSGTAYAATVDTAGGKGKQGFALENLNYDIGPMIQDPGSHYLDAWIWVEDASKVGNLVLRVFGENLIPYGQNGLIEYHSMNFDGQQDLNALEEGKQTWKTGWNHVVRRLSESQGSNFQNNRVRAVVLEEHAADKSYTFALGGLRFVDAQTAGQPIEPPDPEQPEPAGPDADGNFVAFDAAAEKDAADAVQVQPANPAAVTVKNNAELTGGAEGAPAAGTAYYAAFDKSRSGFALEGFNWDVSGIMDKNRPGGVQYQLDAWIWIEDASKVGTFVVRLYPEGLQDTNGSLIELWAWQWNSANDLDDTQDGVQKLQTGWNHLVKNVENLVTRQAVSPTVIDTISIHEHAADKSYSYAVASLSLNRIGVDDGKTYPLVGLNDGCDGINTSRYFYEIYKDGVTSGAAVLGEGQDGSENGALWFRDLPLRAGWIARYGTRPNTVAFSASEDSVITFWLYVSDKDAISDTIFELGSTGNADEQEKEWDFTDQITQDGWNKITLDFSEGVGGLSLNSIRRYRIALLSDASSGTLQAAIDSIAMTGTGEVVEIGKDDSGYNRLDCEFNYNFDAIDEEKYKYDVPPAVETTEKKEGEASLKWTAANANAGSPVVQVRSQADTLDFTIEDMATKYAGFWLYVSDRTKISQLVFELASTGMDTDERQWVLTDEVTADGWNYVAFPLGSGFTTIGTFDPAHIRYWRIFALGSGTGELTVCLDDLSLLEREPERNDDPAKQLADDCEVLNTDTYVYQPDVELDTDAKQGSYSYKFTSPNDEGEGKPVMRYYNQAGKLNFAIENWRTSYVTFWMYVNKASLIDKAAFELSSIGIDASDEFEYAFTDQLISDTWVEVAIPLMAFDPGSLDLNNIRSMRIFLLGDGSGEDVIVKMDDLRLVDTSKLPPEEPGEPEDPDSPDPSQPDDENPETGAAGTALPAALALGGAAILCGCSRTKKHRDESDRKAR